ncbi:MAG: glycosyl hydrolase [Bacteroidetes bacterium]|nr:glycosyl hydrolase [Bacteroidota bacterium]MBL6964059.1 glycosyl hydrolase [Bacteroidota bacterium]
MKKIAIYTLFLISISLLTFAQKDQNESKEKLKTSSFSGLKFRSIGPALMSGRITDFAVNPENIHEFYVTVACGGVWKTKNSGTSWKAIFDNEKSFSIGCVTIDPNNPHTVWVGSGENNSQRSVSWGDGVYKSMDGGSSWKNMGLKKSEHIAKIIVNPQNSDIVYVASQGPLWGPGGDRGLYKTTNGGNSWEAVLTISENTGVTDVVMDPRNPDVLYAASYQRRRHTWTLINGGPEGAIYKTMDGGKSWKKLTNGIPAGDIGRIGLAISPVNPDVIYAIIEAAEEKGGFFKSTNRGESWSRTYKYNTVSAQYYNEIFCDPTDVDKVYVMDTYTSYTEDGGKSFKRLGNKNRHVDDHALWINPDNTNHLLIGGDGGIYETFDHAKTWEYKANLPITQFYRVSVDNSLPFYYVYGGTQDNSTQGGPSQTSSISGIVNSDWFLTKGGDGFKTVIDPVDPNIVYSQSQYGWLVRYNRKTSESTGIKPIEGKDDMPYRWNWDAPLIISPHSHTRLYFAANKVFKSDDRGNTWKTISPDLTRQLNRNELEIMGKVWPIDAVAKNASTSIYGNIVSLAESPLKEGLLYAGTDDGMVNVSQDGGANWKKYKKFPGIPEYAYVSCIVPSLFDENVVFVTFDNHKMADFKPYILKSSDKGRSWINISNNLEEPFVVYSLVQDHVDRNLLFIGTEYGVYFSPNGGKKWIQLKAGLPTIAVRDMVIQQRENDLVLGTFGRSFYILDDYTPLRKISEEKLKSKALIFPVKDALMFIHDRPLGSEKGSQGDAFFIAPNPPFGATFTYYLKEAPKTKKQMRKEIEKDSLKKTEVPYYPSFEELELEQLEKVPYLLFTIFDDSGNVVRRMTESPKAGINRITWDFRYAHQGKAQMNSKNENEGGVLALPGEYSVQLELFQDDQISMLVEPVKFRTKFLHDELISGSDRKELLQFSHDLSELKRVVFAVSDISNELDQNILLVQQALKLVKEPHEKLMKEARRIELDNKQIQKSLKGDQIREANNATVPQSINSRLGTITYELWKSTSKPTQTHYDSYTIAADEFGVVWEQLKKLMEDYRKLEIQLEEMKAPYTPGRMPDWKR